MSAKAGKTLKMKMATRIMRSKADVFVPGDFSDLGGYDQVLRALRQLVTNKVVGKMGYGVYLRLDDSIIPGVDARFPTTDFDGAVRQTLRKLGVSYDETQTIKDYNAALTTQIQSNCVLVLKSKGRFKRKLAYDNMEPVFRNRREDVGSTKATTGRMRKQDANSA